MANVSSELRSLPLEYLIAAPLTGAIKAQGLAANQTVDFIKEIGMKQTTTEGGAAPSADNESLEARYVEFKFDRVMEQQAVQTVDGKQVTVSQYMSVPSKLSIPLLAMIPIPYIRINDMTIDFEFKIKDIDTQEKTREGSGSLEASAKYWGAKITAKGSFSAKSVNKRETDKSATLRITVHAVQDQVPEGLGRVLDMLNEAMKVVPIPNQPPTVLAQITTPTPPANQ